MLLGAGIVLRPFGHGARAWISRAGPRGGNTPGHEPGALRGTRSSRMTGCGQRPRETERAPMRRKSTCRRMTSSGSASPGAGDGTLAPMCYRNRAAVGPIPPGGLALPDPAQPGLGVRMGRPCWQSHQVPPGQFSWCCWRQDKQIITVFSLAAYPPHLRPPLPAAGRCPPPAPSGRVGPAHPAAALRRPLFLVQPAPGPVLLRTADRIVETLGSDRAGGTDRLRLTLADVAFGLSPPSGPKKTRRPHRGTQHRPASPSSAVASRRPDGVPQTWITLLTSSPCRSCLAERPGSLDA